MARLPSLNHQMHGRMEHLKCIGESRYLSKQEYKQYCTENDLKRSSAKTVGIHSYKTYEAYKQTSKEFIRWLKNNYKEIKDINLIKPEHVKEYLKMRENEGKSAYTISKDMSALNKLFNFNIDKNKAGLNKRSYINITRSRLTKDHDKKYNEMNYEEQIIFAKATGCRRQKLCTIKPEDFIFDENGQVVAVNIYRDKGGRSRTVTVLKKYRKILTEIVKNKPLGKPLFDKYTKMIDNHAFRSEYAIERYKELLEEKKRDDKDYRGYDLECVLKVSQDLGHNRPCVVVEHYFRDTK